MTPFAADITARHRADVAAETADLDAEIARLEDDVRTATLTLRAAMNRRTAILQRHDAALFAALYVKVDADGCPVPRPGPPMGTVRRKGGAVESPTPAATTEGGATPGADAFFAVVADSRTPEQARLVLRDRGWDEDGINFLTPTALIEVARRNLRPEQVEINEDGGAGVAGGEVIA